MSKKIFTLCEKLIEEKGVTDIVLAIAPSAAVSERDIRLSNDKGEAGESLSINKETGVWYDHATGDKGNLVELWRRVNGLANKLDAASDMLKHFGVSAKKNPAKPEYVPMTPVPDDAPEPPVAPGMAFPGKPDHKLVKAWKYADTEGRTHHYRVRYDGPEDENGKRKKVVVPLSYCGAAGWRFKAPKGSVNPLYNLPALLIRGTAPIILTEGEKAADAAAAILPDYVAVSWAGGSSSTRRTDWSPLRNRNVVYWPDADAAGEGTISPLIDLLTDVSVASIKIVKIPATLPKGWDLADEIPDALDIAALIDGAEEIDLTAAKAFLGLTFDQLVERVYYVVADDVFYDPSTGLKMVPKSFSSAFAHLPQTREAKVATLILSKFPGRKVDAFGYKPGEHNLVFRDDAGVAYVNSWKPSGIGPVDGDASVFEEHLRYIAETDEQFAFLANTLAFMLQHPEKKLMFAVVLIGLHGTGKSYIAEVMRRLVGYHNSTVVSTNELKSDFNEYMLRRQLIVVEEIMTTGRLDITNTLKPFITQPSITVNVKYQTRTEAPNHANFIFCSNHFDAIRMEKTERRFWVLLSNAERREKDYYDRLWSWTFNNLGVVLNWFLERDLTGFSHTAEPPMTEGRATMIEAGRSELELDIAGRIEDREHPFRFDLVELDVIKKFYRDGSGQSGAKVSQTLHALRCQNLRQHKLIENGNTIKRSLWCVRDFEKWLKMSPAERLKAFLAFEKGPHPAPPLQQEEIPF